ncbi:hypothetical protein PPYR_12399 [Photinus pyralis]|uniref:Vacuolar ATPase assembly integral membrane protein VMA21 homolog n=1 Tax=Photinus pyralis TaxID=7054 RepID=A0A5N4AE08_PHOPY|nr:hypothetical protein PPYR_12399 [Photinus pyralis]
MDNREVVNDNEPLIPAHTRQAAKAIALLLFYSFLMFTLPFAAFFGTKYVLKDSFGIDGYANTVWSVIASVVTVNLVILAYAYYAYHDPEYDNDGNRIDTVDVTKSKKD